MARLEDIDTREARARFGREEAAESRRIQREASGAFARADAKRRIRGRAAARQPDGAPCACDHAFEEHDLLGDTSECLHRGCICRQYRPAPSGREIEVAFARRVVTSLGDVYGDRSYVLGGAK